MSEEGLVAGANRLVRLPIVKMQDVLLSRIIVREEGERKGFAEKDITNMATAVSEIARNVVQYAGEAGSMSVVLKESDGKNGLHFVITDKGRGFTQAETFLNTNGDNSMGSGLACANMLMDEFDVQSKQNEGTTVTMTKWQQ